MDDKFRIDVITKQSIPININNPILNYIQDNERKGDRLFVKVYYDNIEIGRGIILDFYKQFEVIEDFGEAHTRVLSFEHNGKTMFKNTSLGNMIYRIKNFKNPPINDDEREKYINEITSIFEKYALSIKENINNLKLSYVPSSTKTPDEIAQKIQKNINIDLVNIVKKNVEHTTSSKEITDFDTAMEHAKSKYIFNEDLLNQNKETQYLIVDDVMGNGSTIATILKKLYDITKLPNYFLIVVKDVKRWKVYLSVVLYL